MLRLLAVFTAECFPKSVLPSHGQNKSPAQDDVIRPPTQTESVITDRSQNGQHPCLSVASFGQHFSAHRGGISLICSLDSCFLPWPAESDSLSFAR